MEETVFGGERVGDMTCYQLVYVPCKNSEEAQKIAAVLLEKKLIACANIIGQMTSMYRWQGKIATEQEALLLAKTTEDRMVKVQETVTELHSYDCPCVVSWTLASGHPAFLKWLEEEIG